MSTFVYRYDHGVFAAGDITEIRDRTAISPPTAQTAEQGGVCAAKNILASIRGTQLHPAKIKMEGMMVALGGNYAAVSLLGWIRISGYAGYLVKTVIMRGYRYLLHRQCTKGMEHLSQTKPKCHTGF
jgi:NADH:ubiquinone reductase (H+-translocating)